MSRKSSGKRYQVMVDMEQDTKRLMAKLSESDRLLLRELLEME